MSQYKLWALKTGRLHSVESDPLETPQLWWGTKLEPIVREAYSLITGREITDGVTMIRHPELECMIANTDGTILEAEGMVGPGVYEGKTTTIWSKSAWEDGVPLHIQAQVQHYMACTGLTWGSAVVYIAGERQPIHYEDIHRNDDFIAKMMVRCQRWWERHVLGDEPPEADGSEYTKDAIAELYPLANGEVMPMSEAWLPVRDRLVEVQAAKKQLEAEENGLKNKIRAALGESEYAQLPDGTGWSLKSTHRKGHTKVVPPASFRVLRAVKAFKEPK
jgi:predicted phage-related endonuclease